MLFPTLYAAEITAVNFFTALILPVSVVGAIMSGLIDGKMKFKRLTTPLIVRKIVLGGISTDRLGSQRRRDPHGGFQSGTQFVVLVLGVGCLACAVLLGMAGKSSFYPSCQRGKVNLIDSAALIEITSRIPGAILNITPLRCEKIGVGPPAICGQILLWSYRSNVQIPGGNFEIHLRYPARQTGQVPQRVCGKFLGPSPAVLA